MTVLPAPAGRLVGVRAPRAATGVTSAVLALALLTGSGWLVAAQGIGLLFVVGAAGYLTGVPLLGAVATGLALVAALLNAAVGSCLGCEVHPPAQRAGLSRTVRTNP